jgi:hypothetical protein
MPAITRPCNRYPCPNTISVWAVGGWSSCSPDLPTIGTTTGAGDACSTAGHQTRRVTCQLVATGATLPDAHCHASGQRPDDNAPCTLALAPSSSGGSDPASISCECGVRTDCPSPSDHWECDATMRTCKCGAQWGGPHCDVPLLPQAPAAEPCLGGVVDVDGVCCEGYIDMVTGKCCDGSLDRLGTCCAAPLLVDACGVCGGTGIAVDALGECCGSVLAPSGLCCVSGHLDSCGVCDGSNACRCVTLRVCLCTCFCCCCLAPCHRVTDPLCHQWQGPMSGTDCLSWLRGDYYYCCITPCL